jgi:hypothetical protein
MRCLLSASVLSTPMHVGNRRDVGRNHFLGPLRAWVAQCASTMA